MVRLNERCFRGLGVRGLAILAGFAAAGRVTTAALASDTCATATSLSVPGTVSGTTAGLTTDGASSCGQTATSPDAWYRIVAPSTCTLRFDTCGSGYDTVLSVHTGCPGAAANELGCNDDSCALGSTVLVNAVAGQTYYARIAGWDGASGPFTLSVGCLSTLPLDSCAGAANVGVGSYAGTTQGATVDGVSSCGQTAAAADHWYRFTPTEPGVLTADTCGSAYDTVLSLHTGCPGSGANELACNDDTCLLGSVVQAVAIPGQPILIRVSGWNGATGAYTLNVSTAPIDAADACAGAIEITDGSVVGSTLGATADGSSACEAGNSDVWYRYTAPASCTLLLDTCGGSGITFVSVHGDCPGTGANQLACGTDPCGDTALAVPLAINQSVYIRVASAPAAATVFMLSARCASEGADVLMGELAQFNQYGRVGDVVGCAIDTPVCNAGTEPFDWYVNPDPRHPFMVYNMYRLKNGRLEQIGMSWAKHGFGAAQDNACGLGCTPFPNNTRLGVGCSDTYDANLNAVQSLLGPRHEINAWTGAYNFAASHLSDPAAPPHTPISHRLQVRDADLDPASNPGALYLAETYVFGHDDVNHMNSIAHEPVLVSGAPGGTWSFNISSAATAVGPAINSWPGATRTTVLTPDGADGRCIVAAKVADNGDGTWRYEYAVYNHDLDRGARSFSLPLRPGITLSNIGFSAVRSHDEPFSNVPWAAAVLGGAITWSTSPPNGPSPANPLRWGTMYNFWFDADAPPVGSTATLGLFKLGPLMRLRGATPAPAPLCLADVDLSGLVNSQDISAFLTSWLTGGSLDADFDGSGAVNSGDISAFLTAWLAAISGGC